MDLFNSIESGCLIIGRAFPSCMQTSLSFLRSDTTSMHVIAPVHPFPDLPLDIARLILETTAVLDRGTALRLALVSKLVRAWYAIDPVLYHTVILNTRSTARRFIFSIDSRPSAALLVRNLCLWSGDGMGFASSWADTDRILSACRNVVRFSTVTCDTGRLQKYLGDDGTLQPRYMALHVGPLTPLETEVLPRSLTHLKLSYTRGKLLDWAASLSGVRGYRI
ncbi:hypothetical protein BDZ89DRAFT_406678 [Hymenopellis radicata]|nr:hypothetical protein BDZ89DRAFT_406678 [Hymenopellis radicata]